MSKSKGKGPHSESVVWNANGMSLLHQHERESVEAGESAHCQVGALYVDNTGHLWCDTAEGPRLLGATTMMVKDEPSVDRAVDRTERDPFARPSDHS